MVGLLIGDMLSLLALLKLASGRLSLRAAGYHLTLLAFPALLAAIGALHGDSINVEVRALIVAAGVLVIGLDIVMAYQSSWWTIKEDPAKLTVKRDGS